jgi:rhodanese-related sulfurtransferase
VALAGSGALAAKTVYRQIPVTVAYDYYRYHAAQAFKHFEVLDVRPADRRGGEAIKSARALPFLGEASRKAFEALDGRKAYMLYCADGKRAAQAMAMMRELHFREVYNIEGGFAAWKSKKYPTERVPPPRRGR